MFCGFALVEFAHYSSVLLHQYWGNPTSILIFIHVSNITSTKHISITQWLWVTLGKVDVGLQYDPVILILCLEMCKCVFLYSIRYAYGYILLYLPLLPDNSYNTCTRVPQGFHWHRGNHMKLTVTNHSNYVWTHWGGDKIAAIRRRHFKMHFIEWKCINFA